MQTVPLHRVGSAMLGSVSILVLSSTCYAQDAAASTDQPAQEEIVVTAQKRGAERLRDVPISISVVTGEQLDQEAGSSVNDVLRAQGGVAVYDTFQSGGSKLAIRGVTSNASIFSGGSTIAYYLDGVPFGFVKTPFTPDANPFDLDNVQILRGPQGTLYGSAALGGVVLINTHEADVDELDVKARTLGSFTHDGGFNYSGDAAVNIPLIPGKLAVRGVASYQNYDGWIDSAVREDRNSSKTETYRVKLGWLPTYRLRVDASGWWSRDHRGGFDASLKDRTVPTYIPEPITTKYDIYSLHANYDMGDVAIDSVTSHLDYFNTGRLQTSLARPTSYLDTTFHNKVTSQEVRLYSTNASNWKWSVGAFYRDAEDFRNTAFGEINTSPQTEINSSESYALFGEVTRILFEDRLELTGGLRYFRDDVSLREISRLGRSPTPADRLVQSESTYEVVTPRGVATFHVNPATTAYASYSQGFRSGFELSGDVQTLAPTLPPVKPDKLTNYEVGIKGSLGGRTLSYEIAAFYIDWKDTQQQLFIALPNIANVNISAPINVGRADGPGFDASLSFRPTGQLTLSGSVGYNKLEFAEPLVNASGITIFDVGDRLPESPAWTANAGANYEVEFGQGWSASAAGAVNYTSKLVTRSPTTGAELIGDNITTAKASVTIASPMHWTATLFAENLTDEDGDVRPVIGNAWWQSRLRPRTIGLQLNYKYR